MYKGIELRLHKAYMNRIDKIMKVWGGLVKRSHDPPIVHSVEAGIFIEWFKDWNNRNNAGLRFYEEEREKLRTVMSKVPSNPRKLAYWLRPVTYFSWRKEAMDLIRDWENNIPPGFS